MESSEIRRLIRRSKKGERDLGRWLQLHDEPDSRFTHLTSSTGRVGHLTGLRFDVLSKSYTAEQKNVKLNAQFLNWWLLICDTAADWGKEPLLHIQPSNVPAPPRKSIPDMHIITANRHAELLAKEKIADELVTFDANGRLRTTPDTVVVEQSVMKDFQDSLPRMTDPKPAFRPVPKPVKAPKKKR
jgi:hypothetical protein